ncbi:hypothetical protein GCM10010970_08040 [Silvimonas iriomotensis]|uniref:Uncharacterized protein n=1 Tax=Silvimonas iriomotensis TaxID=449662 RepID=A0ABQ2P6K0_9NEIS|nr:hypothetical protein GCM10010970_08040 [Silvimonas iriomotensis]
MCGGFGRFEAGRIFFGYCDAEIGKGTYHDSAKRKAAQEREAANEEAAKVVANGEGA